MDKVKKCTKCGKELSLDQFHKKRLRGDSIGYQNYCKDCKKGLNASWRHNNSGYDAMWRKNNPESNRARCARWQNNNPDYSRKRRSIDTEFRLIQNIRAVTGSALKNNAKTGHTVELLGCSIRDLCSHLERQFTPGMTWDNYGRNGWHIDHIIPLSYFDLSDPDQQKRAWHYTNLQPLWAIDNIIKSNKIIEVQLILL